MAETNEQDAPTIDAVEVQAPEGVTFPWQMSWGTPSEPSPQNLHQASAQRFPWQMEWGRLPEVDVRQFNDTMGFSPDFENVFERLIQAESRGRHRNSRGELTTSPVGAQGITQVMPKTAKNPGYGVKPIQDDTEEEYLRFGRDYLQAMVKEFDGDYRKALAAYNAGAGSVKRAVSRAKESGKSWEEHLPKKSETIPYMDKILGEG